MPRVAITDDTFLDLELERAILSATGFELRSENDKEIPALKSLVAEADEFDWRKQEERLNRLPHVLADIEGLRLHFIHQRRLSAASGRAMRPVERAAGR